MVKNLKEIRVLDIINLSKPQSRIIVFITILLALFLIPVSLLEKLPNFSICHYVLWKYCYSVGITRGVSSLLKGNVNEAISYNPLSIIVLIIVILMINFDFLKLRNKKFTI